MVDQAEMTSPNGTTRSPPNVVARNVFEVAHDVVALAEMQFELGLLELQQLRRRALPQLAWLVVVGIVLLGCVPVVLLGLAYGLTAGTGWPLWLALLLVSGGAALLGGVAGAIALRRLKASTSALNGSQEELRRNVEWIKQVFTETSRCQEELR
jgi:hypothetical protein